MAPTIKVAVIQMYAKPLDPEANFETASRYIHSAASQGAQLAVLPEYHLTSWEPNDPRFLPQCAQWRHYLEKYRALAKQLSVCIVPGTIVEKHDEPSSELPESATPGANETSNDDNDKPTHRLLNVCYFISSTGLILGRYVKKNLWFPERQHLSSSGRDIHQVFDTPVGKVGLLICWDLAFPEAFRELISQGAQMIIVPTFWTLRDCSQAGLDRNPSAEALFLDSVLTARAFENTCAIVFANAGGPPGKGFAGLSQIVLPFVGPVTRMGTAAEGMSVTDVDMQILEDAEDNYKVRADLARHDWHYDYRHSAKDKQ
ncbi:carbon-nitrogen hydrolase [Sporormia fimetaria CBS 119925]|uniref:Carbon-nitrogen hydrolase n=1 Tax=Sporormia fimetaria CBS 119925 TaxID=1340428 RepID=A0A6A6V548_9PLEO|nr:carbon-nitrogen hydrolase [Sporormia fimetaria CBS 119925]